MGSKDNKIAEAGKQMKGLHTYDMLANPRLAPRLAYIAVDNKNRGDLIMDDDDDDDNNQAQSDMVRAVIGLAYLKDWEVFQFNQQYMMTLANQKKEQDSEAIN
jgi:hypothetical protein